MICRLATLSAVLLFSISSSASAAVPSYIGNIKAGVLPSDPKAEAGTCTVQMMYMAFLFDNDEKTEQSTKDEAKGYATYWLNKAAPLHGMASDAYIGDAAFYADLTAMPGIPSDAQLKVAGECLNRIKT